MVPMTQLAGSDHLEPYLEGIIVQQWLSLLGFLSL